MRPVLFEVPAFYQAYIAEVDENDVMSALERNHWQTQVFFGRIPIERADHRYAPKKWTIKQILMHLADTERIMCYRALRFARQDRTPLVGYDQNSYVENLSLDNFTLNELAKDLFAIRKSTISLFKRFSKADLLRKGIANGFEISVLALGYIIVGHSQHHLEIIQDRYLAKRNK